MKLVVAIIQPTKLSVVREALEKVEVTRMTICDGQGYGQQLGRPGTYRGQRPRARMIRKTALEVVVNDDFLDRTIAAIAGTARTGPEGSVGDGKIFVLPVEETYQISDGTRGKGAV